MSSEMQEMIDEMPYDDPDAVIISQKDIKFLKDEYAEMRREQYRAHYEKNVTLSKFCRGIVRGLEIALIRLGVGNDELDKISRKTYQIIEQEQESRDCGGDY